MAKTLSGIVIEGGVKSIEEIEYLLNCKLYPPEDKGLTSCCSIYFLKDAVFIEVLSELPSEPIGVREGTCLSFVLSGSTDAYSINYCEKTTLLKGFKSLGGERFEEYGMFPVAVDDYSLILETIKKIIGQDIYKCIDEHIPKRYVLEYSGIGVTTPVSNKEAFRKEQLNSDIVESTIAVPADTSESDNLFHQLLSKDVSKVLKTLLQINDSQINAHAITYIHVLSRFHADMKVRREAKKLFKTFAGDSLWRQVESAWEDKHRNIQGYHEKKEYYEHADLDANEYFLFAYVNRRNFFSVKPLKGMYNVYSSMLNNKDDIQNVFECYGSAVENIPEKISTLDHIRVAKFNSTANLNLSRAIEHLSLLPNLHNLVLFAVEFKVIPIEINTLKHLVRLQLYENGLSTLSKDLYLPSLNVLVIEFNDIAELDFNSFPNVNTLCVDYRYKPGAILFKNVKNAFSVVSGKETIEEVNPAHFE
ncbi:hypothetical protein SAMN02745866_00687 [Alteromonadaceae bacterium Bs31]|nr:hypothetical protein SAMN02745866_00687 [Alteromonadaceae bacterium Bs31]